MLIKSALSRNRLLLQCTALLLAIAVVTGCPGPDLGNVELLANGCKRVTFFDGTVIDVRADKINMISTLMEFPYGTRVDGVDVKQPSNPPMYSIDLFPISRFKVFIPTCGLDASGDLFCTQHLSQGNWEIGFSVAFMGAHPEYEWPQLMSDVEKYLNQKVLNCN